MNKIGLLFLKGFVIVALLSVGCFSVPLSSVSAAGSGDQTPPPAGDRISTERLEQAWARLQLVYARQGEHLAKAEQIETRIQALIDKAESRAYDTSDLQAALDAVITSMPGAMAAHESGAEIISGHAGFDDAGKVTDRASAVDSIKLLATVIKNTRQAMRGSVQALQEALRAFREAHEPITDQRP